jgi:hypothetical protein
VNGLTRREVVKAGATAALGLYLPIGLLERPLTSRRAPGARTQHVDDSALEELARRLKGLLLLPSSPGYTEASQPANTRFQKTRPLAVAECADERDVVTCVHWSQAHGIQAVARTGGHSYAGFSTTSGLLMDLGRLKQVHVDRSTGIAQVGGGAVNHDVFRKTNGHEFVLPGGTCPSVGVGGLTLGGGIGYNTHWAGLTCDHLLATDVVTASGEQLHVDESHHGDLLWACRGGAGGSFAINTRFEFSLARIPRNEVAFYRFDYRGADAAGAVMLAFDRMLQSAPPALNAVAMAQATPIGPGGPREAIAAFSRGQYIGPMEELLELICPLLRAAEPCEVTLKVLPYWQMQKMFFTEEAVPHAWGDSSRYSRAPLPADVMAKVMELLAACPVREAQQRSVRVAWLGRWREGQLSGPARHRICAPRRADAAAGDVRVAGRRASIGRRRAAEVDRAGGRDDRPVHAR